MADEISTLSLGVDSTPVQRAEDDLDRLVAAGSRAERSVDQLAASFKSSAAAIGEQARAQAQAQASQSALLASASAGVRQSQEAASSATAAYRQSMAGAAAQTKLTAQQAQQLGFQLNDLFVQIASGQSAVTALIQQGSQLSGTFGGIGNTVRALATTLSPLRVLFGGVAAAVGVGVLAYKQGSEEADKFRRALVLTGNAAGVTIGQLQQMASAVAGVTGATQGKAAEVLTQLAASAAVARGELASLTEASIRMERAGGSAASETAKAFADLARNPAEAAKRLSESTKFLTADVYAQIRALEDQGRTADAAAVAQTAYAKSVKDGAAQLERGLGTLEKAWRGVGDIAKAAWDAMVSSGRPATIEGNLAQATAAVEQARGALAIDRSGRRTGTRQAALDQALDAQSVAQSDARLAARAADITKIGKAAEEAGIKLKDFGEAFKTPNQQLGDQLSKIETWRQQLKEAGKYTAEEAARLDALTASTKAHSQAASIAAAVQQARISGQADRAALTIQGQINSLQLQRQAGMISEIELIERSTDARIKALDVEKQKLELTRRATVNVPQNAPAIAALDQQIQTVEAQKLEEQRAGREAVAASITKQRIETEKLNAAERDQTAVDIAAFKAKRDADIKAGTSAVLEYVRAIDESNERTALEAALIGATSQAREVALAKLDAEFKLRRQIDAIKVNGGFDEAKRVEETAKVTEASAKERAGIETRVALDEWKKTNDQIAQSLTDSLMQGGRSFRDYLVSLFRTTVFRPVIQAVFAPFAAGLTTAAQAFSGGGTVGAPGAGGGQPVFQAASLFNAGKSIYEGFASSFSGIGMQVANAYGTTIANAAGTGLDGFLATNNAFGTAGGAGGTGTAIGSVASAAAGAAAGIYGGRAISGGYAAFGGSGNGTVNAGTAIGAVVGSIVPGVGTAIGAAVGGVLGGVVNRLFGRRAPEVTGRSIEGSISGADFSGSTVTDLLEKGGLFRSDKRSQITDAITGDLDKALDEGAKSLSDLAAKYGAALGLPAEQLSSVTAQIKVKITDDAAENSKAITEALQQYADALLGSFADDIEPFRKSGETVAQTIERVGGSLLTINASLDQLGIQALATSIDGGKAAVALADLFGGAGNFAQASATYYSKFYSEAERANKATEQITKTLSGVGVALPESVEAFRAAVEQAGKTIDTAAGRDKLAALLGVADAFYAVEEAAGRTSKRLGEIAQERSGLEAQLLELQGNTVELRNRERAALDKSNRALYDQVKALEDQAEATKKAADAAEEAAREAERQAQRERSVVTGADSVIDKFLSGPALINFKASRINEILTEGGITGGTIQGIIGSTREDITRLWNSVGTSGREAILSALGLWEDLDELVNGTARKVADFRSGSLADQIFEAGIASRKPADRVAELRQSESFLFSQLGTADNPVEVAERLTRVITRRISEEAALREDVSKAALDGLRDQLEAAKALRDTVANLPQFVASLKFSDLSPLSPRQQVEEARKLFESTLVRAQGGDKIALGNLQGNAQAFIAEANAAFGSDGRAAAVFDRVTSALEQFASIGNLDPQIAAMEAQLTAAETTAANSGEMLAALLRIDASLAGRVGPGGTGSGTSATTGTVTMTGTNGVLTGISTTSTAATAGAGGTSTAPVVLPPVLDFGQRTDALFRTMLERLTNVQTNTGRLEQLVALQGSELQSTREGFSQLNARAIALEGVQTRMLAQITNGRQPT